LGLALPTRTKKRLHNLGLFNSAGACSSRDRPTYLRGRADCHPSQR
jgi:hypothetical protein